jgi:phosphoribosylaminoimidazolecarboxamide formyltransferase/IMP cyclohydrolase
MAATSRFPTSLSCSLYSASTTAALQAHARPHCALTLAASQSSLLGGAQALLSAKQRHSLARPAKSTTLYASTSKTINALPMGATSPGVKQALILLSNHQNLGLLANGLDNLGYKLVSTGGTATALEKAGYFVTRVEGQTSFLEMLDGKTLLPAVQGIGTPDVVVVNLHPFNATVTSSNVLDFEKTMENVDIGGSSLIRAAAKKHKDVMVVVDPDDYSQVLAALQSGDGDDSFLRRRLAGKAFQHAASYDSAVAEWLWKHDGHGEFPPSLTVPLKLKSKLRYGENLHQRAAFYEEISACEFGLVQYHGKEMSYNNYLDADAAWNCVCEFQSPTCVVVKHTNPCGVASVGPNQGLLEAYRFAVMADPVSAYGGIVAFNVEVDERLAREIREFRSPTDGEARMFYELVVAPSYTEKGLAILKGKSKTLRIFRGECIRKGRRSLRQIAGGWLVQECDDRTPEDLGFRVVTSAVPTPELVEDAKFAWRCCKHVKSNAVVVAKGDRMLGMGSGQPNRAQSLRIALEKAGDGASGAALASDAYFPFAWNDAVEDACKAGVKVIVQPGGSKRDQDAIDCCNKYGVAMLFTGVRHFRH